MPSPAISILLPAYNAEEYLREAIDSLLTQTLTDFELLILNDGSADATEQIIQAYPDERIVYIRNESNHGLIYTLNKGIEAATGKYIARMDADDICLPQRLQKQYDWLEKNTSTSVVACHVAFINEQGYPAGEWKEDMQTATAAAIRRKMVWQNCIAHPTVMMRANVAKQYSYKANQKNIEDYDLWLRLLADGHVIEKVPEKLLQYRVHQTSVTGSILRKANPFFKQYNCKRRFLLGRMKQRQWGMLETQVLFTMLHNRIMGIGKYIASSLSV